MPARTLLPGSLIAVFVTALSAQCVVVPQPPGLDRLFRNQALVTVELSLDHKLYFPGETFKITVVTTNPTSNPLEILDPPEAAFYSEGTERCGWPLKTVRTVQIGPGQTIRRNLDSTDPKTHERSFLQNSVFCDPGIYKLCYGCNSLRPSSARKEVAYQVGVQVLEASAVVIVPVRADGSAGRSAVVVLAVRLDPPSEATAGPAQPEHVLVISRSPITPDIDPNITSDRVRRTCNTLGGFWSRLANIDSRVTTLAAVADSAGKIRIDSATESGSRQTLSVDARRNLLAHH